ncbi:MAG: M23 family metallopeptidase [Nitrospirota bacterium]|jgi:murein DD-endopeptidase MepM/ murein hydrolase activator NlpD
MPRYVLAVLFAILLPLAAQAAEIEVAPDSLAPGDSFVIKVFGAEHKPLGLHEGGTLNFAPCGKGCYVAIGAVDLKRAPGAYGVDLSVEGEDIRVAIDVLPTEFPVVELTLPPGKVTPSPEDEERAEREARMLRDLWSKATGRLWQGGFILPLENGLTTAFGVKRIMNKVKTSVHTGVDMRGMMGEAVRAANRGRVVVAQELFYGGNTVVLDHGQGIYTVYMHLSRFRVAVGDVVEKGDTVGEVGATGRATGPHLHFSVKVGEASTNPVSFARLPL